MKSLFSSFVIALFATAISGCFKNPDPVPCTYDPCAVKAPATEIATLQSYLDSVGISATQHCSGLFYIIETAGTGVTPEACQDINVKYHGRYTNGASFDSSSTGVGLNLGSVIRGWTNGVPLIKEGGKIKLFIPPSLAYGPNDYRGIPGNSILVFDVELVKVY